MVLVLYLSSFGCITVVPVIMFEFIPVLLVGHAVLHWACVLALWKRFRKSVLVNLLSISDGAFSSLFFMYQQIFQLIIQPPDYVWIELHCEMESFHYFRICFRLGMSFTVLWEFLKENRNAGPLFPHYRTNNCFSILWEYSKAMEKSVDPLPKFFLRLIYLFQFH